MAYNDWGWRPYVSVAERWRKAAREMEKRRKQGRLVSPVIIEGRTIVKTFWGKTWCENLERYSVDTAILRTAYRGVEPTCATDPWSTCRSAPARFRRLSVVQSFTRSR